MVFEFQIIKRYLIPSKKRVSNSFISSISIFTISLTVSLLIIFLSVLKGVEKNWVNKLTTLQSPIRLIPNQKYYTSDYFTQDGDSEETFYQSKSLFEKANYKKDSSDQDLIYDLIQILNKKNLKYDIYEVAAGILKIHLSKQNDGRIFESTLTQASYLTNAPTHSKNFIKILQPYDQDDIEGLRKLSKITPLYYQIENGVLKMPSPFRNLEPILLPKNFKDAGTKAGDRIEIDLANTFSLTGNAPTLSGYVCGFYDPGMMSVGTRVAFFRQELIEQIVTPDQAPSLDPLLKGGFFVYLNEISQTKKIAQELKIEPIMDYFDVVPYYEFEFAKEIMRQFESDQVLFLLIGFVILVIACLNIIAALVLIVQEKRQEIGLLMALGASKKQIQTIFGSLGFLIGLAGFIIGTCIAVTALYYLEPIVKHFMFLKGHPVIKALNFEPGSSLISFEIIGLTLLITPFLAMIAGLIPAKKASKIEPVEILKNG